MARGIPYAALRWQPPLPRIVSQPGKKNGLDESPLGVLAASAAAEGYRAGQQRMPYHGTTTGAKTFVAAAQHRSQLLPPLSACALTISPLPIK